MDTFSPSELLFEIPVYRTSEQAFADDVDQLVRRAIAKSDEYWAEPWQRKESPSARQDRHESVERLKRLLYGRPWFYNEMIGVIRVYQDGQSIKGEYWGQDNKVFRRNFRRRRFEHLGRVLEWHPATPPSSSQEVFKTLLGLLSEISDEDDMLTRRHLDLQAFSRTGPETDWLRVLSWSKG